ncbi:hypothetical protein QBC43DRAFT_325689 [Cladorrhinum sp. PSN259]|nr:hypothetical protein QBC43DRAFT_325689 [Cladorrhinum sp. PSN259]
MDTNGTDLEIKPGIESDSDSDYDDIPEFEVVEDGGRGKILPGDKMKFRVADLVQLSVNGVKSGPFLVSEVNSALQPLKRSLAA